METVRWGCFLFYTSIVGGIIRPCKKLKSKIIVLLEVCGSLDGFLPSAFSTLHSGKACLLFLSGHITLALK